MRTGRLATPRPARQHYSVSVPRYFHPALEDEIIGLAGDEAHHALRVRRVRVGEIVSLFDGNGGEAVGVVSEVSRSALQVLVHQRFVAAEPTGRRLTLAVAVPKGERGDWMIEKAAELGVVAVWPLLTARGVVRPGLGRLAKWRRMTIESNKQSGRSRLMEICEPLDIDEALRRFAQFARVWLASPDAADSSDASAMVADSFQSQADLALIGPEGGWEESERACLVNGGARPLRLGPHILRVETAAVAAAAVWAFRRRAPHRD